MADIHKQVTQHPRQRCYFCGSEGPIETHHIVPRRYGGDDGDKNLVDLCPTCHERLERLYNQRFYEALDTEDLDTHSETSKDQRDRMKKIKSIVAEIEEDYEQGAPMKLVTQKLSEEFAGVDKPKSEVHNLRMKGEIYEPTPGFLRTT